MNELIPRRETVLIFGLMLWAIVCASGCKSQQATGPNAIWKELDAQEFQLIDHAQAIRDLKKHEHSVLVLPPDTEARLGAIEQRIKQLERAVIDNPELAGRLQKTLEQMKQINETLDDPVEYGSFGQIISVSTTPLAGERERNDR